jgi:hypothetical protein
MTSEKQGYWSQNRQPLLGNGSVKIFPRQVKVKVHRNRPPDSLLTLNGRNIPFVNSAKYLGLLFDKRMNDMEITHRDDRSQGLQNIH